MRAKQSTSLPFTPILVLERNRDSPQGCLDIENCLKCVFIRVAVCYLLCNTYKGETDLNLSFVICSQCFCSVPGQRCWCARESPQVWECWRGSPAQSPGQSGVASGGADSGEGSGATFYTRASVCQPTGELEHPAQDRGFLWEIFQKAIEKYYLCYIFNLVCDRMLISSCFRSGS